MKGSVSCMCGSLFSEGLEFVAHKEVFAPRELALAGFCSDWLEGRRNGVGLHRCCAVHFRQDGQRERSMEVLYNVNVHICREGYGR